jgi:hypothetical protein
MIGLEAEPVLRDVGCGAAPAFTGRGQDSGIADYMIDADTTSSAIIVASSPPDSMTNQPAKPTRDPRNRQQRPPRAVARDRGLC